MEVKINSRDIYYQRASLSRAPATIGGDRLVIEGAIGSNVYCGQTVLLEVGDAVFPKARVESIGYVSGGGGEVVFLLGGSPEVFYRGGNRARRA